MLQTKLQYNLMYRFIFKYATQFTYLYVTDFASGNSNYCQLVCHVCCDTSFICKIVFLDVKLENHYHTQYVLRKRKEFVNSLAPGTQFFR